MPDGTFAGDLPDVPDSGITDIPSSHNHCQSIAIPDVVGATSSVLYGARTAIRGVSGATGTALGACIGLLAGVATVAIDGFATLVAARGLAVTLAGISAGAAVGTVTVRMIAFFTREASSRTGVRVDADDVRHAGTQESMHASDSEAPRANAMVAGLFFVDFQARDRDDEESGCNGADPEFPRDNAGVIAPTGCGSVRPGGHL